MLKKATGSKKKKEKKPTQISLFLLKLHSWETDKRSYFKADFSRRGMGKVTVTVTRGRGGTGRCCKLWCALLGDFGAHKLATS